MVGVPRRNILPPSPAENWERFWGKATAKAQGAWEGMMGGLMAPGNALRGEYEQLEVRPDGSVSQFDPRMVQDASSLAGMVTLGSGALPGEIGALRMGAKFSGDVPPADFPIKPGEQFNTIRNTEGAKNFAGNAEWMRLDPHGKWMSYDELPDKPGPDGRWVKGKETFNSPLYIDQANGQWKQRLSEQYGGATGKKLTEALRKDGYDAIVTFDKYGASEMVKLDESGRSKK